MYRSYFTPAFSRRLTFPVAIALLLIASLLYMFPQCNRSLARAIAASTTSQPTLQLPWMSGVYGISGNSYGCGDHVDNPGTKYRDAFAIDFGLPTGTKVAAVANGIAHTGNDGAKTNYGFYIWIAHTNSNGSFNGYVSLYAHLSSFNITDGQTVNQGDWIGNSGSTGNSSGPHLHFSFRSGFDGTNLSSAAPAIPEPMSNYTGFKYYGSTSTIGTAPNNCGFRTSPHYVPYVGANWGKTGFNPQNTGYNNLEHTIGIGNVGKLVADPSINLTTNSGFSDIFNGIGYVFTTNKPNIYLSAYDVVKGTQLWNVSIGTLGVIPITQAVVSDGILYFINGMNGGSSATAYAVDAGTGSIMWSRSISGDLDQVAPVVANNLVYLVANNQDSNGFPSSSNIYVYNVFTNKLKWSITINGFNIGRAAITNKILYAPAFGTNTDGWYAFDANTGQLKWPFVSFAGVDSPYWMSFAYGYLFVAGFDTVYAYDGTTGAFKWSQTFSGGRIDSLSEAYNNIYFIHATSSNTSTLSVLGTSGNLIWSTNVNGGGDTPQLTIANGVIYAITIGNGIYTYNASKGGNPLWTASFPSGYGDANFISVEVVNGVIYDIITSPTASLIQRFSLT